MLTWRDQRLDAGIFVTLLRDMWLWSIILWLCGMDTVNMFLLHNYIALTLPDKYFFQL